jgi:hypothetical protein
LPNPPEEPLKSSPWGEGRVREIIFYEMLAIIRREIGINRLSPPEMSCNL